MMAGPEAGVGKTDALFAPNGRGACGCAGTGEGVKAGLVEGGRVTFAGYVTGAGGRGGCCCGGGVLVMTGLAPPDGGVLRAMLSRRGGVLELQLAMPRTATSVAASEKKIEDERARPCMKLRTTLCVRARSSRDYAKKLRTKCSVG